MAACPTVKVIHPDGFMIISESDFDPEIHTLFGASPVVEEEPNNGDELDPRGARESQLMDMEWREIKSLAESLGIEKPEGGWDEAVPLILEAEYGG